MAAADADAAASFSDPVSIATPAVVAVNKSCMAVILLCLRCVVPNARTSRHLCGKLQFDQSVKETQRSAKGVQNVAATATATAVWSWRQ